METEPKRAARQLARSSRDDSPASEALILPGSGLGCLSGLQQCQEVAFGHDLDLVPVRLEVDRFRQQAPGTAACAYNGLVSFLNRSPDSRTSHWRLSSKAGRMA